MPEPTPDPLSGIDLTQPATAPPGLRRAGIGVGIAALAVVAIGLALRSHDAASVASTAAAQGAPVVQLVSARDTGKATPLLLPGTLEAWTAARIFARVPGYVHGWQHDIGDRVSAGAPLGSIDTPEIDQQIIEARATLARTRAEAALARTTAARWNDLLSTHSVSEQEADEKNGAAVIGSAEVNEAQARLGRLLAMKAYATLRAPFAGVVTARNADIGDLVGPGSVSPQPLFTMAAEGRIRIYVNVPQQYSAVVRPGTQALLSVPEYPGRAFPVRIIGVSGAINTQTGTAQVQLATDNADGALKAGGYAQVRFDLPSPPGVMTIPSTALVLRAGGSQVAMVTGNGRVHLVPVTVGRDMGGTVEVTTGLPPQARIIDNPPDSLAEGEAVRIAPNHG
jgi:RND family efflux transporter MFP subunit